MQENMDFECVRNQNAMIEITFPVKHYVIDFVISKDCSIALAPTKPGVPKLESIPVVKPDDISKSKNPDLLDNIKWSDRN